MYTYITWNRHALQGPTNISLSQVNIKNFDGLFMLEKSLSLDPHIILLLYVEEDCITYTCCILFARFCKVFIMMYMTITNFLCNGFLQANIIWTNMKQMFLCNFKTIVQAKNGSWEKTWLWNLTRVAFNEKFSTLLKSSIGGQACKKKVESFYGKKIRSWLKIHFSSLSCTERDLLLSYSM